MKYVISGYKFELSDEIRFYLNKKSSILNLLLSIFSNYCRIWVIGRVKKMLKIFFSHIFFHSILITVFSSNKIDVSSINKYYFRDKKFELNQHRVERI